MGIGIIEVMLQHFFTWLIADTLAFKIYVNTHLVFTYGFLLLSGLGLFYSFYRDNGIKKFYIRRIERLLIPYVLMAIPFVGFIIYLDDSIGASRFMGWVLGIGYFIPGQVNNMWYIALSLVLYFIFPFVYKLLFTPPLKCHIITKTILLVLLGVAFGYSIKLLYPDYFSGVAPALIQFPTFFVGILIGYLSMNKVRVSLFRYLFIMFPCLIVYKLIFSDSFFIGYLPMISCLVTIPFVCYIIEVFQSKKVMKNLCLIFAWFGKYSLELYVLHLMLMKLVKNISPYDVYTNTILVLTITFLLLVPVSKCINRLSKQFCAYLYKCSHD